MSQEYQFKGIKTPRDLKICLTGYDEYCEYPINSNWSFTKYFFADSFIRGLRLQNSAEELFQVFVDLRREHGLSQKSRNSNAAYNFNGRICIEKFWD